MKAYKKQLYLNLTIIAVTVGCACSVLMVCTSSHELRATDADNGYSMHTSYQPRRTAGTTAWNMPAISVTTPRAAVRVTHTTPAVAAPATPASGHLSVGNTFGSTTGNTVAGSGYSGGSSAAGNIAHSQTVHLAPVTGISLNTIRRHAGTQTATTSSIAEPFSDPQRPQTEIHQRIDLDGGKDEPFYEPVGDGLWFLLLCSAAFLLRTVISSKKVKEHKL